MEHFLCLSAWHMHRQLLDNMHSISQGWREATSLQQLEQQVFCQPAVAVAAEHALTVRARGCAIHALCSPGMQAGCLPHVCRLGKRPLLRGQHEGSRVSRCIHELFSAWGKLS